MGSYQYLKVETEGQTTTIAMDRPPRNLLSIDMMEEINEALLSLRGRPELELLILRGTRDVFSEGLDPNEQSKGRIQRVMHVYTRIFETLRMIDVISLAAVEGRATGGGFELALGCNLILAAESATFALPEITRGSFPPIASIVLPRVAPRRRAMEWILTGCPIPAGQLEHFGVVNRVLPEGEFEERLQSFAEEIVGKSGPVLQLAKRAQFEAYYSTYEEALYKVQNLYLRDMTELHDWEEGTDAAIHERAPEWENR